MGEVVSWWVTPVTAQGAWGTDDGRLRVLIWGHLGQLIMLVLGGRLQVGQAGSGFMPGLGFPGLSQPKEFILLFNKFMHLEFGVPTVASYTNRKVNFWTLAFSTEF